MIGQVPYVLAQDQQRSSPMTQSPANPTSLDSDNLIAHQIMQPVNHMVVTENEMIMGLNSLSSARNSASLNNSSIHVKGIRSNFPPSSKKLFTELNRGRIDKAFVQPVQFKYGNRFDNKSEEARFTKKYNEIIKLRHILLTD